MVTIINFCVLNVGCGWYYFCKRVLVLGFLVLVFNCCVLGVQIREVLEENVLRMCLRYLVGVLGNLSCSFFRLMWVSWGEFFSSEGNRVKVLFVVILSVDVLLLERGLMSCVECDYIWLIINGICFRLKYFWNFICWGKGLLLSLI